MELFKKVEANPIKAVVVFSGGQDSTTCLFSMLAQGASVFPVTFDYSQRHQIEINAAKSVLWAARKHYKDQVGDHEIITLGPILKGTSPLVSDEKLEQYKDSSSLPGGLEKTFVPMRNQLFLTVAANRAAVLGAEALVTGVCEADYGGYPDCRAVFIEALEAACNRGTFTGETGAPKPLKIITPLMHLSKADAVKMAVSIPGCYEALAYSHTAYDGKYPPTGHDHATLLRAKGFEQAGVPDPLVLQAWVDGFMALPGTANYAASNLDKYMKLAELY